MIKMIIGAITVVLYGATRRGAQASGRRLYPFAQSDLSP